MGNLESTIQANIIRYLKQIPNAYCLRPIICSEAGHPDIIVLITGIMIGMEVKQPGKKPTKLQIKRMEQIRNAGGQAFVVTSVPDTIKVLEIITNPVIL
jgi:hypothetical protein